MTTFHVPGPPVPKARPRVVNGRTYTPKRTRDYEALVGACYHGPPHEGKVTVELEIHLPNRRRVDIDNICKSVMDGLEGHAYANDGQVYQLIARKWIKPGNPGVWGAVRRAIE